MAEDWITTAEAAQLSGYNVAYLRELIRNGQLRAQKWGRDWQVSRSSLLAFMRAAEASSDNRRGAKKRN